MVNLVKANFINSKSIGLLSKWKIKKGAVQLAAMNLSATIAEDVIIAVIVNLNTFLG